MKKDLKRQVKTHSNYHSAKMFVSMIFLIGLVGMILYSYFPVLFNDFQISWDDHWMLLENPILFHATWESVGQSFITFYHNQYSPVNQLYYLGIYHLAGFDPMAFHLGSIVIHVFNSILVFLLISKLIAHLLAKYTTYQRTWISFLVAVIFAIHPLQVESVAWISASKVILYSTFTLMGLISYLQYKMSTRKIYLIITFLSYAASLMVKEQAVIFPLNLLLLDFIYHQYHVRSWNRNVWLEKIPFFLLGFLYWYWSAQHHVGLIELPGLYPWYDRIVFGSYSLMIYIVRYFAPINLMYFYGYPMVAGESMPPGYYLYLGLALIFMIYLIDLYRSRRWVPLFALLFFVINILLVLHILPVPRGNITADRYMYLSVIGLSAWSVWALGELYSFFKNTERSRWIIKGATGLVIVYLIGCMIYSRNLTRNWKDSDTLKAEVKEHLDSWTDAKRPGDEK